MRAALQTRRLGRLCCGYTRRPGLAGLERRWGKGLGESRSSRILHPRAGFLIPTLRVRRWPGSGEGKRIPNREEGGGRRQGDARAPLTCEPKPLRPPRAPPAAFRARAHAPARFRSPAPGLPAAPLGFRKRRERKGEVSCKGRPASVEGAGPVPSAGFSSLLAAGVTEHGGPWRPTERLHLPRPFWVARNKR